jgi:hypothetical protein
MSAGRARGAHPRERAAVASGDDCIALHAAERADLRTIDVHCMAVRRHGRV